MRERERGNNAIRATTTIVSLPYFTSFAFFSLLSLSLSLPLYVYIYVHRKTTASSKEKDELLAHMQANKRALCINVTVKKAITVCFEERERTIFSFCLYMYICAIM
jgi:hypothetical protein